MNSVEAGGVLMGFRRAHHLHVVDLTEPFPTDRSTRTSFRRERTGHAEVVQRRWFGSARTCDYLGEWHTHPEDYPTPSAKDRREWRALVLRSPRSLVFLIAGIRGFWLGVGNGASIECVEYDETD